MANVKITALNTITPAATDVLPVVDVSANSGAGITSKTTVANIPKNASNGTAATPSHSFAGDTDTGMWRRAADTLAFSTGAAQIVELASSGNVLIGGTLPSAPAISLNNDGSANFSSPVTTNGATAFFSSGLTVNSNIATKSTANGVEAKYHFVSNSGHGVASLNADGDNSSGYIDFHTRKTGSNYQRVRIDSSGDFLLGGTLPASPAIELNNNGSSTFQGELTINRPTGQASALVIRENNVEKIKLKPNGQALFSGPVSIGGTAAINTIDVYEEGSITPSVEFGGSATGITYNSRIGKFTRIGDQVTIYVFVALSDKGTSTGNAIIKTLPFTSANIVASNLVGWPGVVAGRQQNFSGLDVNNPNIGITVARNGVGMLLRTVSGVNLTDANFTNGSIIEYQLTYTTN